MDKPIVFMFSGQGSQYFNMGRELYDNHPRFKLWMDHCDELAEPLLNASLLEMIFNPQKGKGEPFDQLTFSNPALLSIEYSLARVLMESGIQPDYLLGYSLGEFSAAVVGGAIELEEGLALTIAAAGLMDATLPHGGMLAIIESPTLMVSEPQLFAKVWLTGRNFANNFVVGGLAEDLSKLDGELKSRQIITQRLPVRHAFHTPVIDPIANEFKALAADVFWSDAEITTWSALKAAPLESLSEDYCWQVIREPVNFDTTILAMLQQQDCCFIDVGPSGTLATSVKYIKPKGNHSDHFEVMNQYGKNLRTLDNLQTALAGRK